MRAFLLALALLILVVAFAVLGGAANASASARHETTRRPNGPRKATTQQLMKSKRYVSRQVVKRVSGSAFDEVGKRAIPV